MPLKTWVDLERLEAADLNAAFAWSQELTLPGAWAAASGTDAGTITSGATKLMGLAAPTAGNDPLAMWQSDGKLLIPAGWGGIWAINLVGFLNMVTTGAGARIYVTGMGTGARFGIGGAVDSVGSVTMWHASFIAPAIAGASVFTEAGPQNSDASAAQVTAWSMVRLGRGLGGAGAVALASTMAALATAGDEDLTPLPAPEEA